MRRHYVDNNSVKFYANRISCELPGTEKRSEDWTLPERIENFLQAVSDPAFNAASITNKALQEKLIGTELAKGFTGEKLCSKMSRKISLLRSQGIIRKLPNQHKYALTDKGRKISSALMLFYPHQQRIW